MKESSGTVAKLVIVVLIAALGVVAYLGLRPGPSRPPAAGGASPAEPRPVAKAAGSAAPPAAAASAAGSGSAAAAPPRVRGFIPSADLSAVEQGVLERLNQVRANPPAFVDAWKRIRDAEAHSHPCTEPPDMLDPILAYLPRQALAANQQLTAAARLHARDMIARDFFDHVNPDGVGPNARVIAAGYPLPVDTRLDDMGHAYSSERDAKNIESIEMRRSNGAHRTYGPEEYVGSIDTLVIDSCVPSRGHRTHLLSADGPGPIELEVGIGTASGDGTGSGGRPYSQHRVVVEIATRNDGDRFVLGVVYRDANSNGHFDVGEGVADQEVAIAAAGVTTKTAAGGGYALPVPDGTKGEVVVGTAHVPFAIAGQNFKVDVTLTP